LIIAVERVIIFEKNLSPCSGLLDASCLGVISPPIMIMNDITPNATATPEGPNRLENQNVANDVANMLITLFQMMIEVM